MTTVIDYFEVWADGASRPCARFILEDAAKALAAEDYCRYVVKKSIVVFDNLYDYKMAKDEELREKALSKLSAEEKKALGL